MNFSRARLWPGEKECGWTGRHTGIGRCQCRMHARGAILHTHTSRRTHQIGRVDWTKCVCIFIHRVGFPIRLPLSVFPDCRYYVSERISNVECRSEPFQIGCKLIDCKMLLHVKIWIKIFVVCSFELVRRAHYQCMRRGRTLNGWRNAVEVVRHRRTSKIPTTMKRRNSNYWFWFHVTNEEWGMRVFACKIFIDLWNVSHAINFSGPSIYHNGMLPQGTTKKGPCI